MEKHRRDMFSNLYYEYFAAAILEVSLPDRYNNIDHIGRNHTPDLMAVNNGVSIGIEVTTCYCDMQIQALFDKYCGTPYADVPDKDIETLTKRDYLFTTDAQGNVLFLIPNAYSFSNDNNKSTIEDLHSIVMKKTVNLSKPHYRVFNSQELFVFSDIINSINTIKESILQIRKKNQFSRYFDIVYIYRKEQLIQLSVINGDIAINEISICRDIVAHAQKCAFRSSLRKQYCHL